jgi:hypothetical protein
VSFACGGSVFWISSMRWRMASLTAVVLKPRALTMSMPTACSLS